jgi:hypothetical protein
MQQFARIEPAIDDEAQLQAKCVPNLKCADTSTARIVVNDRGNARYGCRIDYTAPKLCNR